MCPEDLVLEIANYLRRCGIEDGLVQFEPLANSFGVTVVEIAEQFEAAAAQVDYAVTKKTETRAWIKRSARATVSDGSLWMTSKGRHARI